MGIYYLHMERLKITADQPRIDGEATNVDFTQPSVLIYEPPEDGSLQLVAVENLVFKATWRALGNHGQPVLNGREWDYVADDANTAGDEAHGFMPRWDQHVWLFRDNPAGHLEPFNVNATCAHHMH